MQYHAGNSLIIWAKVSQLLWLTARKNVAIVVGNHSYAQSNAMTVISHWHVNIDFAAAFTLVVSYLQDGKTALYYASQHGQDDVVALLLDKGAKVNQVEHCNVATRIKFIASHLDLYIDWIASLFIKKITVTLCSYITGN